MVRRAGSSRLCVRVLFRGLTAVVLTLVCVSTADAELLKEGWKAAKKAIRKTALIKALPTVNVFLSTYAATRGVIEGYELADNLGNVIAGITLNQPWSIAFTDVSWVGRSFKSATDVDWALAEDSNGNIFGSAASSRASSKKSGELSLSGFSQKSASWLAMGGIGMKAQLAGQALGTVAVEGYNQILDPYNTPIVDCSDVQDTDREVQLLCPTGAHHYLRVYYATASPDSVGPLYCEMEVVTFLEVADSTAASPRGAVRPAVYAFADYYDALGAVIDHREGGDVTNLTSESFTYFESDTARDYVGCQTPTYGYALNDFEMKFFVNQPSRPLARGQDETGYASLDYQLTVGGESVGGELPPIAVALGSPIVYEFPFNATPGIAGTASFDTCSALIRTGLDGDTVQATVRDASGMPGRMDIVFRILPGPGNYISPGNVASGLRVVPTSPTRVVSGDNSFWGQYMAIPGVFATPNAAALHAAAPSGWDPNVWMSARCDTAGWNLFPVQGRGIGPGAGINGAMDPTSWASMYHEDDPHFAALGIARHECFLVDTLGPSNSTNITCGSVPDWVTSDPVRAGYDGNPLTTEGTKILPDGLFTPGTHVEYFLRWSRLATPTSFAMTPDTMMIAPQLYEANDDGHRWQEFGVLPDRWKHTAYGGLGAACMLVVDRRAGRGDGRVWVGVADSIGATGPAKYGAHNGWHCTAAYVAPDSSHNYLNRTVGADDNICVRRHVGNAGTMWDLYPVSSSETANGLGSRLADRSSMGLMAGSQATRRPTAEVLRAYYKMIYLTSGDLDANVLGQDDVAMLEDFLLHDADPAHPRGLWIMGKGFVESETNSGHFSLLDLLGVSLSDPSCPATGPFTDLRSDISSQTYSVESAGTGACSTSVNDVIAVNPAIYGATAVNFYQDPQSGSHVASVLVPSSPAHPCVTLVDGFDLSHLRTRFGTSSLGRLSYVAGVLQNVFGPVCSFTPTLVDVNQSPAPRVDHLSNPWGNPLAPGGTAVVHFGLAEGDRVEVRVYDVAGRLVRTLANREFPAGEHNLTWDGTSDRGGPVSRGVYLTQVRFASSRFVGAKRLVVLR